MIDFGPDDPVSLMLQSIVDKIQEEADLKGLTFEEYIDELKNKLDKQE